MSREILFRGKRIDNGEWVEGFYLEKMGWMPYTKGYDEKRLFLIEGIDDKENNYSHEVDPSTVGQFTGHVISRTNLFDGDVVLFTCDHDAYGYSCKSTYKQICRWNQNSSAFVFTGLDGEIYDAVCEEDLEYAEEIIGNIHDNPELLKEDRVAHTGGSE